MELADISKRIAENVATIRARMQAAAVRAGRGDAAVRLIAVTKYVSPEITRCLLDAGVSDLGESRPQQLWDKAERLRDLPIRWHLIGHLQRNKVNRTLPLLTMLHAVDSIRLGDAVEHWAAAASVVAGRELPIVVDALLEVNISGDASKHGFTPAEVRQALAASRNWPHIRLAGLMAMAGREGDEQAARRDFAALRTLRDQLRQTMPEAQTLHELSMGMSGDYPEAIEEGATMVRVGSALFEGVDV